MPNPPDDEDLLNNDHKLCGFFCVMLCVNSPQKDQTEKNLIQILASGPYCYLFVNDSKVGFRTRDGVDLLLFPIEDREPGNGNSEKNRHCSNPDSEKFNCSSQDQKKKRRFGYPRGNMSVLHQIRTLISHKCLKIVARVVRVYADETGFARTVVLVDVYLPLAVWSGWQFPRSGAMAASLFTHLRCNWDERTSWLACDSQGKLTSGDNWTVWKNSICHVLGCELHSSVPDVSKKKLFELHEIFKSLPGIGRENIVSETQIQPAMDIPGTGIWDMADDVLTTILNALGSKDIVRVAATCRHLRSLASSIMPCMKLKLFPHQQAAVAWMLQREHNAKTLAHPLYMKLSTEDGFDFCINTVSGEISTGAVPTVEDFRGGLFCDEPGLGKTVTALSLILKTQGTMADPPLGAVVVWSIHNPDEKCGFYEINADDVIGKNKASTWKRLIGRSGRWEHLSSDNIASESKSLEITNPSTPISSLSIGAEGNGGSTFSSSKMGLGYLSTSNSSLTARVIRCTQNLNQVKRNLLPSYEKNSVISVEKSDTRKRCRLYSTKSSVSYSSSKQLSMSSDLQDNLKRTRKTNKATNSNETWIQCDACHKWRKLSEGNVPSVSTVWFCSMNIDIRHRSCSVPEESWDSRQSITYLPGFYEKGTPPGKDENVSFFTSVFKEHYTLIDFEAKKALLWLSNLSEEKLLEMEMSGLTRPVIEYRKVSGRGTHSYHKIFEAFGLVRKSMKGTSRWYYPSKLDNLAFDLAALQIALTKPMGLFRMYLSRATLIVVPANLVDHWKNQIRKHVTPGQLRVFVWTDHKKPLAHSLAWDFDIVITTFNRLSAEWNPNKRSVLMQVHWLRIVLDEGHTLGSSLSLTNKLQMAISLTASNRWILTGTPTPNTPRSQVAHLQPMVKFLHDRVYGESQISWESGILKPFEAEMDEGRTRLLQILRRCMISARKSDMQTIPPCVKKVTFLNFTTEHARSYNELVATVRRNILLADWNDPSHIESLLNPKQWKFRSNTIRNVRLSCCVAGHIKVTEAGHDIKETMDILVRQGLNTDSEDYIFIKYSLLNGGNCFRCKEWCRLPVITPCVHLLCLDCISLDSEKCTLPGCGNAYEMQSPEILTRPENPNPKWPVPKDLIELQPSYKQDNWDPDWKSTSSSKVTYLIEKLRALQETNRKLGLIDDNCDPILYNMDSFSSQKRENITLLPCEFKHHTSDLPCTDLPDKVIIFSQFLEHIHVIEQQLMLAGIKYACMYSPMHSSNKMKSLMMFQHDKNCMALLMDGSAALGLDLSFVTHVYLMEPIWDRSMEEQVISRAHRMGATRPIYVETLVMRGTIEEQMVKFLQDTDECRRTLNQEMCLDKHESGRGYRTLHDFAESNYLAQLSLVHHTCNMTLR